MSTVSNLVASVGAVGLGGLVALIGRSALSAAVMHYVRKILAGRDARRDMHNNRNRHLRKYRHTPGKDDQ